MQIVFHYANSGLQKLGMDTSPLKPQGLMIEDNPAMVITTSMSLERIEKLIRFVRYKNKSFLVERVQSSKAESREAEISR
ncbi:hypothetical protein [Alteromonas sp. RKMC-009]|uniref:hypothetical protein n=1 Tax=Alteromonas sp. RKMC-009 TaxID=2267264 RepID=UPI000F0C2E7E|nr:hypothetical protein [Alteromonas sp. RKMC-009]AYN07669.1 hypothetical protein DS731_21995 [Alteromonas sp. RKMC-009]